MIPFVFVPIRAVAGFVTRQIALNQIRGSFRDIFRTLGVSAEVKGVERVVKHLQQAHKKASKSMETALRVEGFRLASQLKKEIRAGAPGGQRFAPLTMLARRRGSGNRLRPDKPLSRLAVAVRYHVPDKNPYTVSVGFTHPSISKSWQRLAMIHQQGFTGQMSEDYRKYYIRKAGELSNRSKGRRMLFLRKSTRSFRTPARPIIDPFWRAHRDEAMRNIRTNFRRKAAGKRI